MTQKKLTLFFPLQVKNKPHDEMQIVCLFSNWVRSLALLPNACYIIHFLNLL